MGGRKSFKQQREKMWQQNPHCRRCGVLTILPKDVPGARFKPNGQLMIKVVPPNMATIQHKYDRLHPNRKKETKEKRHFLWCAKCNWEYHIEHETPRSSAYSKKINQHNED